MSNVDEKQLKEVLALCALKEFLGSSNTLVNFCPISFERTILQTLEVTTPIEAAEILAKTAGITLTAKNGAWNAGPLLGRVKKAAKKEAVKVECKIEDVKVVKDSKKSKKKGKK